MKIAKFLLVLASLAYPFTIVFVPEFTRAAVAVLAVLWALNFCFSRAKFDAFVSAFFVLVFFASQARYLYPVIVSLFLAFVWAASLRGVPMITRFALAQKGELDERARRYTRTLTKIWVVFFLLNALIAYALSLLADKRAWAIYTGAVAYVLVGALFGGDILYRRYILRV